MYVLAADKSDKGVDDAEVLGILHSLYTMTFTSQGRQSVAFVFSLDDNLKVLLPFIEVTGRVSIKSAYLTLLPVSLAIMTCGTFDIFSPLVSYMVKKCLEKGYCAVSEVTLKAIFLLKNTNML